MDAIHLKALSYDLAQQQLHDLATFDNDASGCYDRIVVSLGMIAARRLGMPDEVVRLHATTLLNMEHFICTAHGISEASYKSSTERWLFGTGQGSGASPAVWLTLVICILSAFGAATNQSMNFATQNKQIKVNRKADSFVDDTTIGFKIRQQEALTIMATLTGLQIMAQKWEKLLYATGGGGTRT